jgi:hypothetical protein
VQRKTQQVGFYTDASFGLDGEHRAMDVTLSEAGVDVWPTEARRSTILGGFQGRAKVRACLIVRLLLVVAVTTVGFAT